METVEMTCMSTKKKFSVPRDEIEVVVLKNGRYAYRAPCPWTGKNGKDLFAFKFCSVEAYVSYLARVSTEDKDEHSEDPKAGTRGPRRDLAAKCLSQSWLPCRGGLGAPRCVADTWQRPSS